MEMVGLVERFKQKEIDSQLLEKINMEKLCHLNLFALI